MIERLALTALTAFVAGYIIGRRDQPQDWQDDWEIEVPIEHQRDTSLLMQEPIEHEDF